MSSSSTPRRPINRIKPHRAPILNLSNANIPTLSKESKLALKRLHSYRLPTSSLFRGGKGSLQLLRSKCAAVLVALFVGRQGDLYVLLSKRSTQLRSYAGDTALPGGRVDLHDETWEDTARREAFEEIGLPRDREKVPLLCILEPFLAGNGTVVTPVVVVILDNTLKPVLQPTEVQTLFSHPLKSFLSETAPYPNESEMEEVRYHSWDDIFWDGPPLRIKRGTNSHSRTRPPSTSEMESTKTQKRTIRMHRFLTGREAGGIKPVFGLTAAILIETAMIAYPHLSRRMPFVVYPSTSPTWNERIAWVMWRDRESWGQEGEAEGILLDWDLIGRIAGVNKEERKRVVQEMRGRYGSDRLIRSKL